MDDTDTRPTPEDLARQHGVAGEFTIAALAANGYFIVHPDDFPEADPNDPGSTYNGTWGEGWNACRDEIFGD